MFNWGNKEPYKLTGTTSLIYIPRDPAPKTIRPGEGYFFVQVRAAQAVFSGALWEKVKSLIVTSQIALNHPALGSEPLRAIQRSIAVTRNRAEQLGMSPNLIKLVPATMAQVSISIDFILDKENQLAALGSLINDDAFFAAVSLAPGAAMVARVVGGLSQKILQTFIKSEERQPILQFSGDLNIADGLQAGYYVILGTRDEERPLPNPLPRLEVSDEGLMADSQRVTGLSYLILEVRCVDARTRDLNDGAVWDSKLNQAEAHSTSVSGNPLADEMERERAWQSCRDLLKEAQVLLAADPNYLHREAQDIIKAAYARCYSQVYGSELQRSATSTPVSVAAEQPDTLARRVLDIEDDEKLENTLDRYAEQIAESRAVFRAAGIQ